MPEIWIKRFSARRLRGECDLARAEMRARLRSSAGRFPTFTPEALTTMRAPETAAATESG